MVMFFIIISTSPIIFIPLSYIVDVVFYQRGGHSKYIQRKKQNKTKQQAANGACFDLFLSFKCVCIPVEIRCHVICPSLVYLTPCNGLFQLSWNQEGQPIKSQLDISCGGEVVCSSLL